MLKDGIPFFVSSCVKSDAAYSVKAQPKYHFQGLLLSLKPTRTPFFERAVTIINNSTETRERRPQRGEIPG